MNPVRIAPDSAGRRRRTGRRGLRRSERQHRSARLGAAAAADDEAVARRLRRPEGRLRQGDPAVPEDRRRARASRSASPTAPRATSRARSRAGLPTDVVNFSVEPDVTRLVDAGLVDDDWNAGENNGIPFGSVVTIVDAQGQPEGHQHLGRPARAGHRGRHARTRSARARRSGTCSRRTPRRARAARTRRPGLAYLEKLIGEHVKVQPKSGREATETFLQGTGDVLLSYENEALFARAKRRGGRARHAATRRSRSRTRSPSRKNAKQPEQAKAFVDFLYTPEAQKALGRGRLPAGRRGGRQGVRRATSRRPRSSTTIADLGGWGKVNDELFDPDKGSRREDLRRGHELAADGDRSAAPRRRRSAGARRRPRRRRRRRAARSRRRHAVAEPHRPAAAGGGRDALGRQRRSAGSGTRSPRRRRARRSCSRSSISLDRGARQRRRRHARSPGCSCATSSRGKRYVNALIDLPFALPTIVASIVLLALYGPRSPIGLHLNATRPALVIALLFVTLPFVVRSVQPVLHGGRPRGRAGGGLARRRQLDDLPARSCCRRSARRCWAAPAWRSPRDRRVRLGRADRRRHPARDRGRLAVHRQADRDRPAGQRRGGLDDAAGDLVPRPARPALRRVAQPAPRGRRDAWR